MSHLSRRKLLELGIVAPISRIAQIDSKHTSAIEREELGHTLGESIAIGWRLFLQISNDESLAIGQLQLSLIRQAYSLLYSSTQAYLYAAAYGLVGLALHHQERYKEALHAHYNAQIAATATGDLWHVAQSLICQAYTYQALGKYSEASQTIERALIGLGEIDEEHRRARAHLLGCWADVSMETGEYSLAQEKLENAAIYLDHTALSEEFDRTSWLQLAGKKALMAGEYQQAIDHLQEALALNPPQWVVRQAGILTPLAIAYARTREREQSLAIARQAIPVIGTVNAPMTSRHFLDYIKHDVLARFPLDSHMRAFLNDMQERLPQFASFAGAV
jgi:tetratricopeptide (TPR) repeat protein